MMQKLLQALDNDKEVKELRKQWKEKKRIPFPGYNYDQYAGIEDYKEKIRKKLSE